MMSPHLCVRGSARDHGVCYHIRGSGHIRGRARGHAWRVRASGVSRDGSREVRGTGGADLVAVESKPLDPGESPRVGEHLAEYNHVQVTELLALTIPRAND